MDDYTCRLLEHLEDALCLLSLDHDREYCKYLDMHEKKCVICKEIEELKQKIDNIKGEIHATK